MTLTPVFTDPTIEEMNTRKDKVLALMAKQQLDSFVITAPDSVYWLTNVANYVHERPFILILASNGELSFVVPKLEVMHVESRSIGKIKLITYEEFPFLSQASWDTVFSQEMKRYNRIGIEEVSPHYVAAFVEDKQVSSDLIEQARYVKTAYELNRIFYSCKIATKAMEL